MPHDLPHALPHALPHRPPPRLKLHTSPSSFYSTVTAYGPGYVEINETRYQTSLWVEPAQGVTPWAVARFADLTAADFEAIAARAPELVIFGSGAALRFPAPALTAALHARRIGVETMDLYAACRTYNILMAEERRVLAALLIEAPGTP